MWMEQSMSLKQRMMLKSGELLLSLAIKLIDQSRPTDSPRPWRSRYLLPLIIYEAGADPNLPSVVTVTSGSQPDQSSLCGDRFYITAEGEAFPLPTQIALDSLCEWIKQLPSLESAWTTTALPTKSKSPSSPPTGSEISPLPFARR